MNDHPAVSVCVPTYNAAAFIGEAVESALKQTRSDLEVVVVDNASTDATAAILHRFSDPRLRVVRNPENIGAAANFNRAIALARGRYVKILCADDVLYADCIEKQAAVLDADGAGRIALVGCARDIIDERSRKRLRRAFPGAPRRVAGDAAVRLTVRRGTNVFGEPAAVLVRTATVRSVGGFDPAYAFCLDLDLWCRLLRSGDAYMLAEPLCGFRISRHSWSATLASRQYAEFERFIDGVRGAGAQVSRADRLIGLAHARVNAIGRQAVTRMLLSGSQGT